MLDSFDYKEPRCPLCGGEEFYTKPKEDAPLGQIPIGRIIDKLDSCFAKRDLDSAKEHLLYWKNEARQLKDRRGELSVLSELIGLYRKTGEGEQGLACCEEAIGLIESLSLSDTVSGATVYLNCATTMKAFGKSGEAMPYYIKAKDVYQSKLDKSDRRLAGLYNNMALAYGDLQCYKEAEDMYLSAIEIMKSADNGEGDCAISYINLAYLLENQGKHKNALDCIDKAQELLDSEKLIHNGYYAFVLEKCAPAFSSFGKEELSEKYSRLSAEIYGEANERT